MALRSTPYLRFAIRLVMIAAVAVVLRLPLRAQDNPMDLPREPRHRRLRYSKKPRGAPANGQSGESVHHARNPHRRGQQPVRFQEASAGSVFARDGSG